jgi:hypothetical protein
MISNGNELTSVAFKSPANVWPTRIESSSVANERSWVHRHEIDQTNGSQRCCTLARGIIARKETEMSGIKGCRFDLTLGYTQMKTSVCFSFSAKFNAHYETFSSGKG